MTRKATRHWRGGRRGGSMRTALAALSLGSVFSAHAQVDIAQLNLDKLGDLSLEQLGNISITSVSRRSERLLQAPASVFVITAEDIQRSTVRSLPEALRLAPNLHVARTSAGQWAISARGFNNAIGNKLLVLVDGRTIYSPLFSGVFWDAQDVMLEDIQQIEVISGPGGTLWGANAVNGVINVTTRSASATQGTLASARGGDANSALSARHGGRLGDGYYRVYAMHTDRDNTTRDNGTAFPDAGHKTQAGFRADWGTPQSGVTVQGGAYHGGGIVPARPESPQLSGAHLLARWSREAADGANWHLQGYYDRSKREEAFTFNDDMEIADIEWQYSPAVSKTHRFVWGGGHREARDRTQPTLLVRFVPQEKQLRWTNVFVQDEISVAERLRVTVGAKLERNVYTGWEFLPSARVAWTPDEDKLAWAALSRAVRAPARLDREFFFPGNPPFFIIGGPQFVSETANVLEAGWRAQPSATFSYSATLFHHRYDKLRSGQPPPAMVQNMMEGSTTGIESWAHWQVRPNWRLSAGLNTLHKDLRVKPGSTDPTGPSALGNDPTHQWMLRSSLTIGKGQELDVAVRHVGALPSPFVPAYTAVDVRWGWQVTRNVEASLNVQNLFDRSHREFGDPSASQLRRGGWLKLQWRM